MSNTSEPSTSKLSSSSTNDKLRTEIETLNLQPAPQDTTTNSSTSETPKIVTPTTSVIMSEERPQPTGKILGGAKLSRENHRAFFEALEFWAIPRKLKWIYAAEESYANKRAVSRHTDELETGNAVVMSLLMNQISEEDLDIISGIRQADEVVKELRHKYEDKRPSKVAQNLKEFFSYQFEKNETIMQAWTSLRRIARELAEEDDKYKHILKDENLIYSRLLDALPKEYSVIVDIQRIKKDSVPNMLVELQEKEASLSKKKISSAYLSHDNYDRKTERKSKFKSRKSSSSSSASASPPRSRKTSRPSAGPSTPKYPCYLCGGDHYIRECKYLDEAVKHVSKSRSNSRDKSKSHASRSERPSSTTRRSSNTRSESRGRTGKTIVRKKSNLRYSRAFNAGSSSEEEQGRQEEPESDEEKDKKAYPAEQDYEEEYSDEEEQAGLAMVTTSGSLGPFINSLRSMFLKLTSAILNTRTTRVMFAVPFLLGFAPVGASLLRSTYRAIFPTRINLSITPSAMPTAKEDDEIAAFTLDKSLDSWIGDTGATSHMTDNLDLFVSDPRVNETGNRKVIVGGGQLAIRGKGTAIFRPTNAQLKNVLYVPRLGANLISVSKLCSPDHVGQFTATSMTIVRKDNAKKLVLVAERKRNGGLYQVKEVAPESFEFAAPANDEPTDMEVVGVQQLDPSREHHREAEAKCSMDEYILWHNRFGHLGPNKLRQLYDVTTLPDAIQVKHANRHQCDACDIAKSKKYRNHEYHTHVEKPLELVAADTCGPLPRTFEGFRHFLQIVDHYSNRVLAFPLKHRSDAGPTLDKWKKQAELATGLKVKTTRSDNAPELVQVIERWATEDGVSPDYTAPYTSSQNGKAERAIQNTEQLTRALLTQAQLPITFWPYAVQTASYILNRTATGPKINGNITTPYEAWFGHKPSIKHMKVWGCKCFAHIPDANRKSKLHPRAEEGIFVGYTKTDSQYRIWFKDSRQVKRVDAKCVKFRENVPGGSTIAEDPDYNNLDPVGELRFLHLRPESTTESHSSPNPPIPNVTRSSSKTSEVVGVDHKVGDSKENSPSSSTITVNIDKTPRDLGIENSPVYEDSTTSNPSRSSNVSVVIDKTPKDLGIQDTLIYSETPPPSLLNSSQKRPRSDSSYEDKYRAKMHKILVAIEDSIAMMSSEKIHGAKNPVPTPSSYDDAINDPIHGAFWKEAIKIELDALLANGTFEEARRPRNRNVVTSRWVFTVKYSPDGSVERYKARLVARGFSQIYGLDYTETFAPTLKIDSLRMLLVMMALEDMEAEQVDIANAFTESDLDEIIYMHAPSGFDIGENRVLRLLKSLYGLKQSARQWNRKCDKTLKKLGFVAQNSDPCVYYRESDGAIVGVYVDDMLILAPRGKQDIIDGIKDGLRAQFKIKELGPVKRILGMQVTRIRSKRTVYIGQTPYIEKFLHEYAMEKEGHHPTAVPMNGYAHLHKTTIDDEQADRNAYCKRIGSAMFAMVYTRPDVCFQLSKLSQYMSNPGVHHETAVKQLLRYFRSTMSYQIKYGPTKDSLGKERIRMYCDSDFGQDKDDRRSVLGYVAMFGGAAISWASRRQKSVSTSTTEAEYMALSAACKQSMWIRNFLIELDRTIYIGINKHTLRIYEDNQSVLKLVMNPQIHSRSKHIDIAYHYVRERYEFKDVDVKYINTSKMIADGLTKPLPRESFEKFRAMLGLVDVNFLD